MDFVVTIYRIPIVEYKSEKKLIELVQKRIETRNYDIIPSIFTKLYEWPNKSNVLCATCCCKTSRMPFFIPNRIDSEGFHRGNNPIHCSPSCAIKMVNIRVRDHYLRGQKIEMIKKLTEKMTFIPNPEIIESWDPNILEKFGGKVTDKTYQDYIYINNQEIITRLYTNKKNLIDENN